MICKSQKWNTDGLGEILPFIHLLPSGMSLMSKYSWKNDAPELGQKANVTVQCFHSPAWSYRHYSALSSALVTEM